MVYKFFIIVLLLQSGMVYAQPPTVIRGGDKGNSCRFIVVDKSNDETSLKSQLAGKYHRRVREVDQLSLVIPGGDTGCPFDRQDRTRDDSSQSGYSSIRRYQVGVLGIGTTSCVIS